MVFHLGVGETDPSNLCFRLHQVRFRDGIVQNK